MEFRKTLRIMCIQYLNLSKATELAQYFKEHGVYISHQAFGTYFSERSIPEPERLLEMMDALGLSHEDRKALVRAYVERRPGLGELSRYL
jgi:hypothetical protein